MWIRMQLVRCTNKIIFSKTLVCRNNILIRSFIGEPGCIIATYIPDIQNALWGPRTATHDSWGARRASGLRLLYWTCGGGVGFKLTPQERLTSMFDQCHCLKRMRVRYHSLVWIWDVWKSLEVRCSYFTYIYMIYMIYSSSRNHGSGKWGPGRCV